MLAFVPYRESVHTKRSSQEIATDADISQILIKHHTKSRSGCQTCKTRRIKCDEQKPRCLRCIRSGFHCDGYLPPESRRAVTISQRPHSKSRTGCTTCKARRVKCSEEKPSCSWCAKAGRPCQYPIKTDEMLKQTLQPAEHRPLMPKINVPSTLKLNLVPGTKKEQHSFEFYVSELGEMLSSSFDVEFWTRTLVQKSLAEPALWHSLIALSMLSELQSKNRSQSLDALDIARSRTIALQHYIKAVRISSALITSKDASNFETLVINSLMFACVEYILTDGSRASIHLSSGSKLLASWSVENSRLQQSKRNVLETYLIPMFDHMGTLSLMYDAVIIYEDLKNEITSFVDNITPSACDPTNLAYAKAAQRKAQLLEQSNAFVEAMSQALSRPASINPMEEEEDSVSLIHFWFTVLQIRLHTSLSSNELDYDSYNPDFKEAIEQAISAVSAIRRRGKKWPTSLLPTHQGMPMLFWIIWKCRDTDLRHKALDLLTSCHKMFMFECEGYWVNVAMRVLEIEEEDCVVADEIASPNQATPSLPNRIYSIEVSPVSNIGHGRSKVLFKYKRGGDGDVIRDTMDWVHEYISI